MSYGMNSTGLSSGTTNTGKPFKEKIPKGYGVSRVQQYTPQQMGLHEQQFANVAPGSFLSRLAQGDPRLFEELEAPALRQFASQQGNLAARFSGMGAGGSQAALGGRHSSGFRQGMNQAAADFAQQLQAQRLGLTRQGLQDLMEMSNTLLNQRPFETRLYEKPQKEKFNWQGLLGGAVGGVGGFFAGGGNPMTALMGAQAGYGIGSSLGGHGGGGGSLSSGMDSLNFGNLFSGVQGTGGFGGGGNKNFPLSSAYSTELRTNPALFGY